MFVYPYLHKSCVIAPTYFLVREVNIFVTTCLHKHYTNTWWVFISNNRDTVNNLHLEYVHIVYWWSFKSKTKTC